MFCIWWERILVSFTNVYFLCLVWTAWDRKPRVRKATKLCESLAEWKTIPNNASGDQVIFYYFSSLIVWAGTATKVCSIKIISCWNVYYGNSFTREYCQLVDSALRTVSYKTAFCPQSSRSFSRKNNQLTIHFYSCQCWCIIS
jgi:hypothetical protein